MIIRSDDDVRVLREGGKRLGSMLQELKKLTVAGVSTQALENSARSMIASYGDTAAFLDYQPEGARRPYPAALCISVNDAIVHGVPNEAPCEIQNGDVVTLDMGLVHKGLITDAAVTVLVGGGDQETKRLLQAGLEALDAGIQAARVGNHMGDIGHAIEQVGLRYGYNSPMELGGHSVGLSVHEEPFVPNFGDKGAGPRLQKGMVLAIEPMFTLGKGTIKLDSDGYTYRIKDGSKAVHVEHTILITNDGPEIFTKAS